MFGEIVTFFQSGGNTMLITATAGMVGVCITIERCSKLYKKYALDSGLFMARIKELMLQGKYEEALQHCNKYDHAPLPQVVKAGLERVGCDEALVRQSMESAYLEQMPKVTHNLSYLSLIANAGMLFGLLGTVLGLIAQFAAVGAADASQKAELMASGISHAMNNTALGLMVALPMLVIHGILSAKATKLTEDMEKGASSFLDWVNLHNYGQLSTRLKSEVGNGKSERLAA